MSRIYLDHAATTPVRPEAEAAMIRCLERFGNPSSLHEYGRRNREVLDRARDSLAAALGGRASEIIFTSGGTESDNLALFGACRPAFRGNVGKDPKNHLLVSAIEHHAVLHAAQALAAEGFELELIPVDRWGRVDPPKVAEMIRPETVLVSVMLANNEIGTLQRIGEIAEICHQRGCLIHTDAVQAFGHVPFSVRELGVDLLSISAHKFGGPIGAGALWVREGLELRPTFYGGAQERGRRGGTENAPAIAGMEAAICAWKPSFEEEAARERELIRTLWKPLEAAPGVWRNTPNQGTLPNILNVGFRGIRAETLLLALDLEGVAASSGSACASGSMEPSHVLQAIGLPTQDAHACLRLSVGWTTTFEEVTAAAEIIMAVVSRIGAREKPG